MLRDYLSCFPAPKVGEQPGRNRHRRLTLVCLLLTLWTAIVDAAIEIDVGPADGSDRGGRRNGTGTGAAVNANQNKSREVPQRPLVRCNLLALHRAAVNGLYFASAPA